MEMQPEANLVASVVETDENRIAGADIRRLYESDEYPLARRLTLFKMATRAETVHGHRCNMSVRSQ